MLYNCLLHEAEEQGVYIYEQPLPAKLKGLYCDHVIWINKNLNSEIEKACILAEELGHYYTTSGNILDQTKTENRKQEKRARTWAYNKLIPLSSFVEAHQQGIRNRHELAEFLHVTEEFLDGALQRCQQLYGTHTQFSQYTISFDPLAVVEMLD